MAEPDKDFAAKVERDEAAGIDCPDIPEAEHPVIVHHPDTGEAILYVSRHNPSNSGNGAGRKQRAA